MTLKLSVIECLPDELLLRIIYFAGWRSALALGRTSKRLHTVCSDHDYWITAAISTFSLPKLDFASLVLSGCVPLITGKALFRALAQGSVYTWGQHVSRNMRTNAEDRIPSLLAELSTFGLADLVVNSRVTIGLTLSGKVIACIPGPQIRDVTPASTTCTQIAAGRYDYIVLDSSGNIYISRTRNAWRKQVAPPILIHFYSGENASSALHSSIASLMSPSHIYKIFAGWAHCGAITRDGNIVIWHHDVEDRVQGKAGAFVPNLVGTLPLDNVEDIMLGEDFGVAVQKGGRVYGFSLKYGTAYGSPLDFWELPEFRAPDGDSPASRVKGSFLNFAVFSNDRLLHFGNKASVWNARSLEQGETGISAKPTIIEGLPYAETVDISSADWHHLALTRDGRVLAWGTDSQRCGCLGLGTETEATAKGVVYADGRLSNGRLTKPVEVFFNFGEGRSYSRPWKRLQGILTGVDSKQKQRKSFKLVAGGWASGAIICDLEDGLEITESMKKFLNKSNTTEKAISGGPSANRPAGEKGHPQGQVEMPRGIPNAGEDHLAASINKGSGRGFFGLTGGPMQMGPGVQLSKSRQAAKLGSEEECKEKGSGSGGS